jgi:hypothetical protein
LVVVVGPQELTLLDMAKVVPLEFHRLLTVLRGLVELPIPVPVVEVEALALTVEQEVLVVLVVQGLSF